MFTIHPSLEAVPHFYTSSYHHFSIIPLVDPHRLFQAPYLIALRRDALKSCQAVIEEHGIAFPYILCFGRLITFVPGCFVAPPLSIPHSLWTLSDIMIVWYHWQQAHRPKATSLYASPRMTLLGEVFYFFRLDNLEYPIQPITPTAKARQIHTLQKFIHHLRPPSLYRLASGQCESRNTTHVQKSKLVL